MWMYVSVYMSVCVFICVCEEYGLLGYVCLCNLALQLTAFSFSRLQPKTTCNNVNTII